MPPLPATKTVKVSFERALKACGSESLIETLYVLQDKGVIKSFEIEVQIQVEHSKATSLEQFFLLQETPPTAPTKKKRTT
jgi:hypothetical protein